MAKKTTKRKAAVWAVDPHTGGIKILPLVQEQTRQRIEAYARQHYAGRFLRLDIRFRGPCCYIDAYREPVVPPGWPPNDWNMTRQEYLERLRNTPVHLCRLRYFGQDRWSLAFYTYSNEKYMPCTFRNGSFWGTPEEGFEVGEPICTIEQKSSNRLPG